MGLVAAEPQEGIKTWKPRASDPFVLCPPERVCEASCVTPCTDRKWRDNPQMDTAFWKALDWLIYFDGDCVSAMIKGIVGLWTEFPFFVDEFRLLFRKLQEVAIHLLQDEGMHLWQEITPEVVFRELGSLSKEFDASVFGGDDQTNHERVVVAAASLHDSDMWKGLLPQSRIDADNKSLLIRNAAQGTQEQVTPEYCTYLEALCCWHENAWAAYGSVQLYVCRCREEGLYLRTRHLDYPSLSNRSPDECLHFVLRCCWKFALSGGSVRIHAPQDFWESETSRPFKDMRARDMFHCN